MKKLLCVLIAVGLSSCGNAPAHDAEKASEPASASAPATAAAAPTTAVDVVGEANKALVNRYLEAYLRGDAAGMAPLMTEDFVGYGLGVKDASSKQQTLDSVTKHWEVYKYGGKRYDRIQSIAITTTEDGGRGRPKGDWVLEWGDMSTDYPAAPEYGGVAKTANFTFHAAYRVEDGKITTVSQYFNHEDIMRQLGYKMVSQLEQGKPEAAKLIIK